MRAKAEADALVASDSALAAATDRALRRPDDEDPAARATLLDS